MSTKRPWQSRTMWGGILMLLALILSAGFGVDLTPEDQAAFMDKALAAVEASSGLVGFILVLVGRLFAVKDITL